MVTAAFLTQTLTVDERTVKFEIWDTAGQERYHSLAPMYYRGAQAAIVVYDITSQVIYRNPSLFYQRYAMECYVKKLNQRLKKMLIPLNKKDNWREIVGKFSDSDPEKLRFSLNGKNTQLTLPKVTELTR